MKNIFLPNQRPSLCGAETKIRCIQRAVWEFAGYCSAVRYSTQKDRTASGVVVSGVVVFGFAFMFLSFCQSPRQVRKTYHRHLVNAHARLDQAPLVVLVHHEDGERVQCVPEIASERNMEILHVRYLAPHDRV